MLRQLRKLLKKPVRMQQQRTRRLRKQTKRTRRLRQMHPRQKHLSRLRKQRSKRFLFGDSIPE